MSYPLDISSQISLADRNGDYFDSAITTPAGGARALVVRNIPSGTQAVSVAATLNTNSTASAAGGYTPIRIKSAATTNLTSVKTSAGVIGGIEVFNAGAAVAYLKLYRKASAPVVASDVPIATFPIAPGRERSITFSTAGLQMNTGIAYAITGGVADTDATAVAADQVTGVLFYA